MTLTTGLNNTEARRPGAAFTMIELILVLVVVGIALSAAAPSLRGFLRASAIDHSAESFVAMARWAKTQAITEARIYRLTVDSTAREFWVTQEMGQGSFSYLSTDFGRPFYLGDNITVEFEQGSTLVPNAVDFYPDGTITPASLTLRDAYDQVVRIAAATSSEDFRILPKTEGIR